MKFEWLTRWFRLTLELFPFAFRVERYTVIRHKHEQRLRQRLLRATEHRLGLPPQESTP